ncbi:uncharacterized protein LOC131440566 isoform X2 [Malaya genurostris]|uniref:uncharacterized protein LOC131440566 isoform X2 n=1 Tax=Malaya genurostris TaxID=325434 RepID=UPI0026F3AD24|nr:uncharacterized protein LOC131440566 isoform X2 [Malaya genurostris]
MCLLKGAIPIILTLAWLVAGEKTKATKDSYLAALQNSYKINGLVRIARDDYSSIPSTSYEYSLAPSSSYGAPSGSYGTPPKAAYGPPKPVYGPPQPVYGTLAPASNGMPYLSPESWLLSKLKLKFSWFTLAKILLKLVIFKKIVKFIALLCLLFFIPTLKPSESDGDHSGGDNNGDDYRRRSYSLRYDYDSRLNEVTRFALKAMEAFTIDNELYCPVENLLSCRAKRMFDYIDEEYPLKNIIQMFFRNVSKKEDQPHSTASNLIENNNSERGRDNSAIEESE